MRSLIILFLTTTILTSTAQTPCVNGFAGPYPCSNVDMLSRMTLAQLGTTIDLADLWGWTDPLTDIEYALVGTRTGVSFVDLSDPINPVLIGTLPAHNGVTSLWRDVDTHGNYCFVGSEASGHGLQVFDLTRLRTVVSPPQTFTEDAHYGGFGNSHTIFADKTEPYVYVVGSNVGGGGMLVINVSNPLVPVLEGTFTQEGYIHENTVFTYNGPDTEHVGKKISFNFHINANDRVTIVDVTDKTDINMIATTPVYTVRSLCHQGWMTEDHRFLLMNDEGDEASGNYNTRTHIFNIENLDVPVYIGYYSGINPSYDHNLYCTKGLVWEANYTSGLHILDPINVASAQLSMVGMFDTYTANNGRSYNGAWGNYPFFKSGIVIVSSIYEGLFVLRPKLSVNIRATLQGPYNESNGLMDDELRSQGLIPLQEPYTSLGYSHTNNAGGETIAPAVLAVTGADAIVDWVVLELRDAVDPSIIRASRCGLLQRDSDIVGVNGISPIQFDVAVGNYHVAVRHRNHLGVMSASPVEVSVATRNYDLGDGSIPLFGTEATYPSVGRNVLWAGNTVFDNELMYTGQNNDRDPILSEIGGVVPTNTVSGYRTTDVNMDGNVIYTGQDNDRDIILTNIGGVVPTNIRTEQLP
ncbi:MAG: choice-of-anchor B family protein [Flavobacteriales bacterium]|nr:choice-of-anchor B family protein [Flavobacteriales bacterium]